MSTSVVSVARRLRREFDPITSDPDEHRANDRGCAELSQTAVHGSLGSAGLRGDFGERQCYVTQQWARTVQQAFARVCQRDTARGAGEQNDAQLLLEYRTVWLPIAIRPARARRH